MAIPPLKLSAASGAATGRTSSDGSMFSSGDIFTGGSSKGFDPLIVAGVAILTLIVFKKSKK